MVKSLPVNTGDPGSIPGWGRSPGEGNGNPLQYSCLENLMDRGAWWAILHMVAKSQTLHLWEGPCSVNLKFSVAGRGCVPSLLLDLGPNSHGGNEDNDSLV